MKRTIPWKLRMNLEEDSDYWSSIFQAREEGPRHHQHEDISRYVQQAPDNIRWTNDQAEFDSLYDCGCPCDTLSCFFFTALWLRQSQSILVQETWQPKDIDFTCYKTLLTKSITCLPVGTMSLEWPVALPGGSDQYSPPSSHEDHIGEHPCDALPASPHLRWRRDALQPPQVQQDGAGRNTCVRFPDGGLRCVAWNTRGLIGSFFSSQRNM